MKSEEIRRIIKNTGCFETEKLDNAVKEILLLFDVTHNKKFSVLSIDVLGGESEIIYDTDNIDDAMKYLKEKEEQMFCVDDANFGVINNETGQEYQNGLWYE